MIEPDSCLGVISLRVSSRLIAIIQLSYSLVSLIMIFTSNDLSLLTDITSITTIDALKYSLIQIFIYVTGLGAACLLGIRSIMSVEFWRIAIILLILLIILDSPGSLTTCSCGCC